ncbi:LysR substrate-binding domain-containing protein [Roseovarius ramblicola]|uniref:LysR substrate-binding domain-containing protein n=1 Tax=Roseovarius ramblicola TaxID=2022336 RepID=A0ABV5I1B8_9RHOB
MARRLPVLNQVRAFEAAARHRSFKTAAEELGVTQAAVSHQIKALEETLGVRLFIRRTRAVDLTPEAARALPALTAALDGIEAAMLELGGTAMTGDLAISVAPFYGNRFLLPRLARFHAAHPGLTVRPYLSFAQADLLREGLDGAVRFGTGAWPGLEARLIHRDCVGPVCAPQMVGDAALPMDPGALRRLPLATTRQWRGEWAAWFAALGAGDASPDDLIEHDSRALAFDAALSGNAVCLADIRLTGAAEAAGQLVRLHPFTLERDQGIHAVWPAGKRPDPRMIAFAEWLEEEARAAAQ